MTKRINSIRGYTLKSIGEAKDMLDSVELNEPDQVRSFASDYHRDFINLFTRGAPSQDKAPAVVYYFRAKILQILDMKDDGGDLEYDMSDERFIGDDEDEEQDYSDDTEYADSLPELMNWRGPDTKNDE